MRIKVILLALAVMALVAAPAFLSAGLVNASIQMLIAALFASAFSLLCGQAGMLSFGHSAYFGIGAFATIHAMNAFNGAGLLPTPLLPLVGGFMGLMSGIAAGWFATKRTGVYFSMITLALAELLHALAPHLKEVFGGEAGVSAMRMPAWGFTFGSNVEVYYLTLFWVLLCLVLLYLYTLTPVGRLTLGLRENTHRLRFLGYNVHKLSVLVFAVSAMFSGVAGALQALNIEAANYVVLDMQLSASVVLNSYIGGVKVFLGPAIGAALMSFFGYAVSDLTRSWLLYQGVLFVLVMMFLPDGLVGEIARRVREGRFGLGWERLSAGLLFAVALALSVVGFVCAVELAQRFFSTDYRSMVVGATWPPVALFGREWLPFSVVTWGLPLGVMAVGLGLLSFASRRLDPERGGAS
ncbi:branched-chain amino acid ABC transporter permease [Xanthobacter autotrophicus]|uniref:branched-chain amino acid ABC transporter permease n=1 Tax=Xanthobacter TaxID=279 RepID=UPI0024AB5CED|nr:branched-chain amino acid ABC transporter permease [Xanthobacter autotrophicus]MDI4663006.1 branched-chain amino acid ABC transporter permease [Xanthobacter autotrophicus]